jgi:hypothetical protein
VLPDCLSKESTTQTLSRTCAPDAVQTDVAEVQPTDFPNESLLQRFHDDRIAKFERSFEYKVPMLFVNDRKVKWKCGCKVMCIAFWNAYKWEFPIVSFTPTPVMIQAIEARILTGM